MVTLSTYAALARHNLAAGLSRRGAALTSIVMMFANNIIFFVIWVLYFSNFSSLRGWGLADFSLLMGAGTWGFGVMVVTLGGVREIARVVVDGSLDVHLGRPTHPLPTLLLSRSTASGWGDAASAFVFWCWFADLGLTDLPFAILVSTAGGLVLAALVTMFQSLAFWLPRTSAMGDMFLDMVITITIYPQNIYGFFVRLMLFTALPAAFVTYVPVQAIREGSWLKALMVIAAAIFYSALAAWIFERGLRRYTSGNRMLENR
jgi:ABC-2 type transport system permease protein